MGVWQVFNQSTELLVSIRVQGVYRDMFTCENKKIFICGYWGPGCLEEDIFTCQFLGPVSLQ